MDPSLQHQRKYDPLGAMYQRTGEKRGRESERATTMTTMAYEDGEAKYQEDGAEEEVEVEEQEMKRDRRDGAYNSKRDGKAVGGDEARKDERQGVEEQLIRRI
ncbi:hypothetical protein H0H81_004096 [Sphagnurus paluster]|uniref:Uncharacterized protein n=1 Tax=Sphagnurus paluster TaxID=117069 RepID=A0A9P7K7A2_9AGAR|nr:hypothetical protein H0H81_004096 [Sphagnurus paluster]